MTAIVIAAEASPPLPSLVQWVHTPLPLRGALCASSARAAQRCVIGAQSGAQRRLTVMPADEYLPRFACICCFWR